MVDLHVAQVSPHSGDDVLQRLNAGGRLLMAVAGIVGAAADQATRPLGPTAAMNMIEQYSEATAAIA